MAFELNGFSDAILGQLAQIGIELFSDRNSNDREELVPRAIYEISMNLKRHKPPRLNK